MQRQTKTENADLASKTMKTLTKLTLDKQLLFQQLEKGMAALLNANTLFLLAKLLIIPNYLLKSGITTFYAQISRVIEIGHGINKKIFACMKYKKLGKYRTRASISCSWFVNAHLRF